MLCVSLNKPSVTSCLEAVRRACDEAAAGNFPLRELMLEIRADLCGFSSPEVKELLSGVKELWKAQELEDTPKILMTCRQENSPHTREVLETALLCGVEAVDLEMEADSGLSDIISRLARQKGARYIVSFHDFKGTPSVEELESVYDHALLRGADLVKIVTTAKTLSEASRLLSLYHRIRQCGRTAVRPLVAFTMGEETRFTRELCLRLGAPFTYVALDSGQAVAQGQYPLAQMLKLLSQRRCCFPLLKRKLRNYPDVPVSKSMAQRAILAAALSSGESVLYGLNPDLAQEAADVRSALDFVRGMGAEVRRNADGGMILKGIAGNREREWSGIWEWKVGESGLLTRLSLPLAAWFLWRNPDRNAEIRITGAGTLLSRDFTQELEALRSLGLEAEWEGRTSRSWKSVLLRGARVDLSAGRFYIDGSHSSQLVSGFLMLLPLLSERGACDLVLSVSNPTSVPYIELTLAVLRSFGVEYDLLAEAPEKMTWMLRKEKSSLSAAEIVLEKDWSSVAYLLVADVLSGECHLKLEELKQGTSQADEMLLQVLEMTGPGPVCQAFDFDASSCPDLFPILTVLAGHCKGISRIRGLHRLVNKESNRAQAILSEFSVLGYDLEIEGDVLKVQGSGTPDLYRKVYLNTYGDHRMAMSLYVAALFSEADCWIDCPDCVKKSFPGFWKQWV